MLKRSILNIVSSTVLVVVVIIIPAIQGGVICI